MKQPLLNHKSILAKVVLLVMLAGLYGCASQHSDSQLCAVHHERQLNDEPIIVTTSQGTTEIEPTVVGYKVDDSVNPECVKLQDDYETFNRAVFSFNDRLYRWVLIPVADGYVAVFPEPVRDSVGRFFSNIREPLNLANHLLQFDGSASVKTVGRFLLNSTIGLAGLFDPASHWFDIEERVDTFADTLEYYGVERGHYLVLPIFGSSDVRAGVSVVTESVTSPIRYLTDNPETSLLLMSKGVHDFSQTSDSYEQLRDKAEDPYVFFRELYLQSQMRDAAESVGHSNNPTPTADVEATENNQE